MDRRLYRVQLPFSAQHDVDIHEVIEMSFNPLHLRADVCLHGVGEFDVVTGNVELQYEAPSRRINLRLLTKSRPASIAESGP